MRNRAVSSKPLRNQKTRAFLKWAGGKFKLIETIKQHLPHGETLIEPFVGAASVFMNTEFDRYLLNDINPDLITLYKTLQTQPDGFITDAEKLFNGELNYRDSYNALRAEFNQSDDSYRKSLLFLYLNRHCYNGLCRYSKKSGFNVPFGRYKRPYFPKAEMWIFAEKAQRAEFTCQPFEAVFAQASPNSVIYCDPPYAPINETANFTSYAANGFSNQQQQQLALLAEKTAYERNIPVLISNHDLDSTRAWYGKAKIETVQVNRNISRSGNSRRPVTELMALYQKR